MDQTQLLQTRSWIQEELRLCIDFWLKHGMDAEHGGVYTCLDRTAAGSLHTSAGSMASDRNGFRHPKAVWISWSDAA